MLSTILLVPVIVLLLFVLYKIKYSRRDKLLAKIPSPPKSFLLHNAPQLMGLSSDKLLEKFIEWQHTYGDVFHVTFNTFDDGLVIVADSKIAEVLSVNQQERKGILYQGLARWIGKRGIFLATGDLLKIKTKILSPVFSIKRYESYCKLANVHMNEIIKSGAIVGEKIGFYSVARCVALDMLFEVIMGFNFNSKNGCNQSYVDAIMEMPKLMMKEVTDPISRNDWLHQLTGLYRKEKKVLKVLHDFTRKIVQDRRKVLESNSQTHHEKFLQLDHFIHSSINGVPLSDEEIREELDAIIIGGHDTTKSTSAFILYNLAKYPEVQEQVYHEAIMLLGDDIDRDMNEKDLIHLPYLDAVIKETLRMYPALPFVFRKMDNEVTTGGYTFPKGVEVAFSPFLAGRNPKYFENPLVFDPDRFYGVKTPPPGFIPFSTGARKCLGGNVALIFLKIIITKVIVNFKLSLIKGYEDVPLSMDFIIGPLEDIYLKSEKRQ